MCELVCLVALMIKGCRWCIKMVVIMTHKQSGYNAHPVVWRTQLIGSVSYSRHRRRCQPSGSFLKMVIGESLNAFLMQQDSCLGYTSFSWNCVDYIYDFSTTGQHSSHHLYSHLLNTPLRCPSSELLCFSLLAFCFGCHHIQERKTHLRTTSECG